MSELEKTARENSAKKHAAGEEAGLKNIYSAQPPEKIKIDEETERTLVSVISAALVAVPAGMIIGRMLPEIPAYQIYQYWQF